MKQSFLIIISIFCFSCNGKTEERTLLYNNAIDYREELKMLVKSQEDYLWRTSNEKGDYFIKRFERLNKINSDLEKSFQSLKSGDKKGLLKLRDNHNLKHKLSVKFDNANLYNKIPDSIFNVLIETYILKLKAEFQVRYMYVHGFEAL